MQEPVHSISERRTLTLPGTRRSSLLKAACIGQREHTAWLIGTSISFRGRQPGAYLVDLAGTSHENLDKLLKLPDLGFLIYEMGLICLPPRAMVKLK